jgi:fused signal recognition particle receptor
VSAPEEKKRGLFGRLFGGAEARAPEPESKPQPTSEVALSEPSPVVAEVAAPDATDGLAAVAAEPAPAQKGGWFSRLKAGLTKTSSKLSEGITGLFTKSRLDIDTLDDLEDVLIQADLGVETAARITTTLSQGRYTKGISQEDVLAEEVERVLAPVARPLVLDTSLKPHVILVVGVNGAGKTTTIGKLAQQFKRAGRSVMMAAGDTFRAAAIDQLKIWGERTGAPVVAHKVGADAAGLAFDALKAAREGGSDVLLIDTAGRLQNKQALMDELEKVVRVLRKIDPSAPHTVLLVLDATTGQNALSQVEVFKDRAGVTGLVMTKLDGTARGGILVAISARFGLPVHAIGVGETADDLQPFDPKEFARAIAVG